MQNNVNIVEPQPTQDGWKFEKRIGIGNLIAGIVLCGTIFCFGSSIVNELRVGNANLDKRVSVVEMQQSMQSRIDGAQDRVTTQSLARIEASLDDMQKYLRDRPKQ